MIIRIPDFYYIEPFPTTLTFPIPQLFWSPPFIPYSRVDGMLSCADGLLLLPFKLMYCPENSKQWLQLLFPIATKGSYHQGTQYWASTGWQLSTCTVEFPSADHDVLVHSYHQTLCYTTIWYQVLEFFFIVNAVQVCFSCI